MSDEPGIAAPDGDGAAVAAAARAGEPDRYLAALLAPPPRARGPAGAGGIRGRACAHSAARRARAPDGRDPPAMVARRPGAGRGPSVPATAWRTPCAQAARSYDLPAALLDGLIDARASRASAAAPSPTTGRCTTSCGGPRAPCSPWLRGCWAMPRAPTSRPPAEPRGRPTAWRVSSSGCRAAWRRAASRLPQTADRRAPDVTAHELLAGTAGAAVDAAAGRLPCANSRTALPARAGWRRSCRAGPASPSFLWPWSGLMCEPRSGRAATPCARRSVLRL